MPPDLTTPPILATPLKPETPSRSKFRVRFRKAGDLRLVSHHDLMHVVERMFRRADLRLPVSQGFNPRPRMWFALSLALGVAGLNEVLELELEDPLSTAELHDRLTRQCPPGLEILSVRAIDVRTSALVRRASYRLPPSAPINDLASRVETFLAKTDCWVERTRPNPRRIDIRPFVHELQANGDTLTMILWITSNGATRPEEVIAALGLKHLLDDGAVIERTDLELYDELPPGTPGPPMLRMAVEEINTNDREAPVSARPTAIISNPMSFDS